MIKTKTLYRVPNMFETFEGVCGTPTGVWCTDNLDCQNMSIEDAQNNSVCLSGNVINESIKDQLIFTFLDTVNYSLAKDKFMKIEYEELIAECKSIEMVVCE
ncbi:MAG: hypothetical protein NC417_02990 [Candidatus Gastranaerophilales bacterium]|nr:hypothetical protein [Candidatus Gastranaerophilales bacterium]MCM1201387.1 hypothetical protein [Bacteroides fragilis]